MGCDVHFYTEVKQPDGTWKLFGEFERESEDEGGYLQQKGRSLYDGRNYNLFAILADVRNGRGFAGIKTGEGFNPISEPRGVPDDASAEYKEIVDNWAGDGHSHSHHTLRQLLDYDWTQTTQLQGWTSLKEWVRWAPYWRDRGHGPNSYSAGVSGPDIKHLSSEQMEALTTEFRKLPHADEQAFFERNPGVYGQAVWQVPYCSAAGSFMSDTIPHLLKLANGTAGLDDIRIVFFFDN